MSDSDDFARGYATGYGNDFWSNYGAQERARQDLEDAIRRAKERRIESEYWAERNKDTAGGTVISEPAEPGLLGKWYDHIDAWAEKLPRRFHLVFTGIGLLAGTGAGLAMDLKGVWLVLAAIGGAGLGALVIPALVAGVKIVIGLALFTLFAGALYLAVMLVARLGG